MLNKISEFDEKYFNIYLSFLERTLVLSEFDVFEELLDIKKSFNVDINIKIGHLLYHYQFADLAVQFYQQAGNKHFDEQAYLNIIKEFKKQNMSREAFNFALEALNKGFTHFTLVEEVVEFTGETKDKAIQQQKYEIFKFVLNLFPDSSELQNLIIKAS
ncbi:glycosyl transferase, group 2 family protein [Sporolactobacillus inulinus]|uniref:Glycosyl transferase, group 2 family protein n=2 Tax=Sporolactobacillus inulinus TaxID=2078 RepID=A0A4Y1ZFP8_9BACL|nr:glycosyl transferase, group 2 family protein [Sporolactobacillus inulinus]